MGIFSPGRAKYAYQGELTCPYISFGGESCGSKAIRYIEDVTPYRLRYRCRKCGGTFQYDISNRTDLNPYAPFQKGRIWSNIMRVTRGRKLKGGFK
jgi:hypothetical protein